MGAALDDLGLDFELGLGDAPEGDPFGPMRQGFQALDLDDKLMVELWASGLIGEFRAELRDEPQALACTGCGLVYRVDDGIPVLLVEEAIATGQVADFPA